MFTGVFKTGLLMLDKWNFTSHKLRKKQPGNTKQIRAWRMQQALKDVILQPITEEILFIINTNLLQAINPQILNNINPRSEHH